MGPPDRCQHAAHIISELILTAQVGPALRSVSVWAAEVESATQGSRCNAVEQSPEASQVTLWEASSFSTSASFLSSWCFFLLINYHSAFIDLTI